MHNNVDVNIFQIFHEVHVQGGSITLSLSKALSLKLEELVFDAFLEGLDYIFNVNWNKIKFLLGLEVEGGIVSVIVI